jgi:Tfp pilus assembly protein PilX
MSSRDRGADADEGFALVASLLAVVIVSAVVAVLASSAIGELRSTGAHRDRESAIHAAEAVIDVAADRIAANAAYATGHAWPFAGTPTAAQERTWARTQLATALAAPTPPAALLTLPAVTCGTANPACTPARALMIRPTVGGVPLDVVYGVAAAPGDPTGQARVIRADVGRDGHRPQHAVLTGWNVLLDAELTVQGTAGNVHVNGELDVRRATTATGDVTATGALLNPNQVTVGPGRLKAGGQPAVAIPAFTALDFYARRFQFPAADWYDLCPDGRAHDRSVGAPCSGAIRPTPPGLMSLPNRWEIRTGANTDGVYYVHQSNLIIAGNPGLNAVVRPRMTFIVSEAASCGTGGAIDVDGNAWINPYMSDGTLLIGDREVRLRRSARLGEASAPAFVGAGGRIRTDNDPVLTGAVLAQNRCPSEQSQLQGRPTVVYDGNLTVQIPVGPIRIGAWDEL